MKTKYQKVLCVAVLLGSAVTVSAQEDETKKKLDREMTLEREYAPTVQDANKVNTLPAIKEPQVAGNQTGDFLFSVYIGNRSGKADLAFAFG